LKLSDLAEIALKGGEEVMAVYGTAFDVEKKDDSSPVTEADLRCEAVIKPLLKALPPDVVIMSAGDVPAEASRMFLVDPLDGTKEFVNRNGDFTVNIALIENGVPVAGVVYAPAIGKIWAGSVADGAYRGDVEGGRIGKVETIATRPTPEKIVAVGSRSHGASETAEWLKRFDVDNLVSRGSSLKFCLVAEGDADVYPRLGRTMEWDTAAGDAVLRAAGGLVTTLDGKPLVYGKRRQADDVDFANPHFVAFGQPGLAEDLS